MDLVAEEVVRFGPRSALEMGCGYGRNLIELRKRVPPTQTGYGLDRSLVGLFAASINTGDEVGAPLPELILGDFRNSGLPSRSVDVVYSVWSLPYGCLGAPRDLEDILREILRVARKGIVLVEPDFDERLWGLGERFGFWRLSRAEEYLRAAGVSVRVVETPLRINPFVALKRIAGTLASSA